MNLNRPLHRLRRFFLALLTGCLVAALPVQAQVFSQEQLRGEIESLRSSIRSASQPAAAPAAPAQAPAMDAASAPLPPDPAKAAKPVMFGSQLFAGRFGGVHFTGFNPDYQISVGDRLVVRLWGAYNHESTQTVDPQGNIFIPNVGPVRVQGVRNADLATIIDAQVKRTYRNNVSVYVSLEAAQPVKVFVTGFVRAPGLYGGVSSDSILLFLDKAGGIDPDRGSYLDVDLQRNGQTYKRFDLYRFLLDGKLETVQLHDGDTLVVLPRKQTVTVSGTVLNPYIFEFAGGEITGARLLAMARPKPESTHMSIVRKVGVDRRSESYPISEASNVRIEDGDEVSILSDKYPGTILVRLEGAHRGPRTLILPYGSTLKDALAHAIPSPQANMAATQLFRKSVAAKQKEMIEVQLRGLETYALTARSATSEEALLRQREADQILKFVERARSVQPKGQVVLANGGANAGDTLLEDSDVLQIPERNNLVLVGGEVMFPNAVIYQPNATAATYVKQAGGFTQNADTSKLMVLHQDGSVEDSPDGSLLAGDEVMVLPKIQGKSIEITRGITSVIYQIAIAAKVLFGL